MIEGGETLLCSSVCFSSSSEIACRTPADPGLTPLHSYCRDDDRRARSTTASAVGSPIVHSSPAGCTLDLLLHSLPQLPNSLEGALLPYRPRIPLYRPRVPLYRLLTPQPRGPPGTPAAQRGETR
eukprot:1189771-Prorocentrum_minimum.AAC.5